MGASSAEIERQITATRQHLDVNLKVLERKAASGARRVGRITAVAGAGIAAAAVAGIAIYRVRRRRSKAKHRLDVTAQTARRLRRDLARKLKRPMPSVKVVVGDTDASRAPGFWRSIAPRVAATVAVTAAEALASRIMKPRDRASPSASK